MKKYLSFLFIILIIFSVNSCDWQVPSEIHIKGSPSLKLAVGMDFSETFKSMMDNAFNSDGNDLIIQSCPKAVNTPFNLMTFLIRIKIAEITIDDFKKKFNISQIQSILGGGSSKLKDFSFLNPAFNNDYPISDSGDDSISLPLNFGDILDGFLFNDEIIKSKVFISGSDIANVLKVKLDFNFIDDNGAVENVLQEISDFTPQASGIDPDVKVYNGFELPSGGADDIFPATFINKNGNLVIDYQILIDNDKPVNAAMFNDDANVQVELLVWFPLKFETSPDRGAVFKLVDFDVMGDFFNSISESGIIEAIKLQIELNVNPFEDGKLIITNETDGKIINCPPMTPKIITLNFTEDDVKYINNNLFKPKFSIVFNDLGDDLPIPRELKIMTVSVDTVINYSIPVGGAD